MPAGGARGIYLIHRVPGISTVRDAPSPGQSRGPIGAPLRYIHLYIHIEKVCRAPQLLRETSTVCVANLIEPGRVTCESVATRVAAPNLTVHTREAPQRNGGKRILRKRVVLAAGAGKEAKNTMHGITDAMRHEHVVYTLSDLTSTFFTPKGQTEGRLKMTRGKTAL